MSAADEVILSMRERPLDFIMTAFTLNDQKTGIRYWIGNGLCCYGMYKPNEFDFSLVGKIKFHFALREWRKQWIAYKHREALNNSALSPR